MFGQKEKDFSGGWELYPVKPDAELIGLSWLAIGGIASVLILACLASWYLWRAKRQLALSAVLAGPIAPVVAVLWVSFRSRPGDVPNFFIVDQADHSWAFSRAIYYLPDGVLMVWVMKLFFFCFGLIWLGIYLIRRRQYLLTGILTIAAVGFFYWLRQHFVWSVQLFKEGRGSEVAASFNPHWLLHVGALIVIALLLVTLFRAGRASLFSRLFLASGVVFIAFATFVGAVLWQSTLYRDAYYVMAYTFEIFRTVVFFAAFVFAYRLWATMKAPPNRFLAGAHWASFTVGITLLFLPQFIFRLQGMPLGYIVYDQSKVEFWHSLAYAGYIVTAISCLIFAICVLEAIYRRYKQKSFNDRPDANT